MIIAVCSDAHGAKRHMDAMLAALPESLDALCFLGDVDKDAKYLDWGLRELRPGAAFYAVVGNNDPFSPLPQTIEMTFEGVKTMLTHGHLFQVKRTMNQLASAAASRGCALALFGHSHWRTDETIGGVRLINPGALMAGEWALLEIQETEIAVGMHVTGLGYATR